MLACARIGAIHLVVFAGFGSGALAERLEMAGCRVLFGADVTYRKGKDVALKPIIDDAVTKAGTTVQRVVMLCRSTDSVHLEPNRDMTWEQFLAGGAGQSDACEVMEVQ